LSSQSGVSLVLIAIGEQDEDQEDADGAAAAAGVDEEAEVLVDDSVQGFFDHRETDKENAVFCVAVSPTNPNIALSGDQVDRAFLWDISTGTKLHELKGHTDSVISVAFSADGRLAATGSMDGTCKVWAVDSGKLIQTLEGPAAEIEV
jgi:WD40 repeat protein